MLQCFDLRFYFPFVFFFCTILLFSVKMHRKNIAYFNHVILFYSFFFDTFYGFVYQERNAEKEN